MIIHNAIQSVTKKYCLSYETQPLAITNQIPQETLLNAAGLPVAAGFVVDVGVRAVESAEPVV